MYLLLIALPLLNFLFVSLLGRYIGSKGSSFISVINLFFCTCIAWLNTICVFVGRYVWPLEYRCTADVVEVFFFALFNEARSFENVYKFTADQVDWSLN